LSEPTQEQLDQVREWIKREAATKSVEEIHACVTERYGRIVSGAIRRTPVVGPTMAILFVGITGPLRVTPSGLGPDPGNGRVVLAVIPPSAPAQGRKHRGRRAGQASRA